MPHDQRHFKTAIEAALVRKQNFPIMVGNGGLEVFGKTFIHGRRGQKMAAVIKDRGDVGRADQLAVGHVEKV